jgi:hypothetical protein
MPVPSEATPTPTPETSDKGSQADSRTNKGSGQRVGGGPVGRSGGGGGVGSPLRIPLPTNELNGELLAKAKKELTKRIKKACKGSLCIRITTVPSGSLESNGRNCKVRVSEVPNTRWEGKYPVLYVERGGTIKLIVSLECENESDNSNSNENTNSGTLGQ